MPVSASSKYVLPGSTTQDSATTRIGRPPKVSGKEGVKREEGKKGDGRKDDGKKDDGKKEEWKRDKSYLIGRAVEKDFEGEIYRGKVTAFCPPYYKVTYEDGDVEEMTAKEVDMHLCKKPKRSKGSG